MCVRRLQSQHKSGGEQARQQISDDDKKYGFHCSVRFGTNGDRKRTSFRVFRGFDLLVECGLASKSVMFLFCEKYINRCTKVSFTCDVLLPMFIAPRNTT
jgi:hypothetical protein